MAKASPVDGAASLGSTLDPPLCSSHAGFLCCLEEQPAQYMSPNGWPSCHWTGAEEIELASDPAVNESLQNEVADLLTSLGRIPRFIVSSHSFFWAQGFDAIHGPGGLRDDARDGRSGEFGTQSCGEHGGAHNTVRSRGNRRWLIPASLCTLLFALGGVIGGAFERARSAKKLDDAEKSVESLEKAVKGLESELNDVEEKLVVAKRENHESGKEADVLRSQVKTLDDYRRVLKEYDIISPDHLRASLNKLGDQQRSNATRSEPFECR